MQLYVQRDPIFPPHPPRNPLCAGWARQLRLQRLGGITWLCPPARPILGPAPRGPQPASAQGCSRPRSHVLTS